MPIWDYAHIAQDLSINTIDSEVCVYCQTKLIEKYFQGEHSRDEEYCFRKCPGCGWWTLARYDIGELYGYKRGKMTLFGTMGSLNELSDNDISEPVQEVRSFLMAKYDARFALSPKMFEETVASVFSDLGYKAVVTGQTRDGGIDVVLSDTSDCKIGVQVKRYKKAIKVEQIRALVGALLLKGFTKGVFVTTSRFQSGAINVAQQYAQLGYPIELVDAPRFFEALRIAQFETFEMPKELNAILQYTLSLRDMGKINVDLDP